LIIEAEAKQHVRSGLRRKTNSKPREERNEQRQNTKREVSKKAERAINARGENNNNNSSREERERRSRRGEQRRADKPLMSGARTYLRHSCRMRRLVFGTRAATSNGALAWTGAGVGVSASGRRGARLFHVFCIALRCVALRGVRGVMGGRRVCNRKNERKSERGKEDGGWIVLRGEENGGVGILCLSIDFILD